MRLVATSDTHFQVDISKIPDGDVFIHAGDLTYNRNYPIDWKNCIEWLGNLPHKIKLLVPGNHDNYIYKYSKTALQDLKNIGVTVVGLRNQQFYTLENGMTILGLPYVVNMPNWAFNSTEKHIEKYLQKMGKHDIIVSHCPPYKILDRVMFWDGSGEHVGIEAYNQYAKKHNVKTWVSGHVHEEYGTLEVDGCKYYNVAMCDRQYKHSNPPMMIDI